MLFNSIDFVFFLPTVFLIYWFLVQNNLKLQNLFLIISSYIFYGWWDWRFLALIFFSTIVDYFVGNNMVVTENNSKRKFLLWISITTNIGLLAFFKYYNFRNFCLKSNWIFETCCFPKWRIDFKKLTRLR